jgi:hypothetical protein
MESAIGVRGSQKPTTRSLNFETRAFFSKRRLQVQYMRTLDYRATHAHIVNTELLVHMHSLAAEFDIPCCLNI